MEFYLNAFRNSLFLHLSHPMIYISAYLRVKSPQADNLFVGLTEFQSQGTSLNLQAISV